MKLHEACAKQRHQMTFESKPKHLYENNLGAYHRKLACQSSVNIATKLIRFKPQGYTVVLISKRQPGPASAYFSNSFCEAVRTIAVYPLHRFYRCGMVLLKRSRRYSLYQLLVGRKSRTNARRVMRWQIGVSCAASATMTNIIFTVTINSEMYTGQILVPSCTKVGSPSNTVQPQTKPVICRLT